MGFQFDGMAMEGIQRNMGAIRANLREALAKKINESPLQKGTPNDRVNITCSVSGLKKQTQN